MNWKCQQLAQQSNASKQEVQMRAVCPTADDCSGTFTRKHKAATLHSPSLQMTGGCCADAGITQLLRGAKIADGRDGGSKC